MEATEEQRPKCPKCAKQGKDTGLTVYQYSSYASQCKELGDQGFPTASPSIKSDADHLFCYVCRTNYTVRGEEIDFDPDSLINAAIKEIAQRMERPTAAPLNEDDATALAQGNPEVLP